LPNLRGVEEVAINAEVVEGRARPLYVHSSGDRAAAADAS
jgi:ATP-dependent Clp protease ATP-binding subunit ClpX